MDGILDAARISAIAFIMSVTNDVMTFFCTYCPVRYAEFRGRACSGFKSRETILTLESIPRIF